MSPIQHNVPEFEPKAVATVTLTHVPDYGKVRIILTPGVFSTHRSDGVREFSMADVANDNSLSQIRERFFV
jgi:hypothetical protein